MSTPDFNVTFNKVMSRLDSMSAEEMAAFLQECEDGPIAKAFECVDHLSIVSMMLDDVLEFQVRFMVGTLAKVDWKNMQFYGFEEWRCQAANEDSYWLNFAAA